jgi:imidazolonepropionase-like amidohydrolase
MRVSALMITMAAAVASAQPPTVVSLANVTVVSVDDGARRVANVVIRGGRIAEVSQNPPPAAAAVIDARGKFLIPGLWDMHVHLATRPEPELAERMLLPLFLVNGIVGVRDMGGPLERLLGLRDHVAKGQLAGPRILTPGPFVDGSGDAEPMFRRAADAVSAQVHAKELVAAGVDFLKAQAGLSPEAHAALARAALAAGLPLAGHIPLSMTAEEVIASGQRSIEHISPALVGDGLLLIACSSKSNQLVTELRAIERDRGKAAAEAIADREATLRRQIVETYDPSKARALGRSMRSRQLWIVPTLIWSASLRPLTRAHDGRELPLELVPVALRTRWQAWRRQFIERQTDESFSAATALAATAARAVRDLHQGGARILAGTDAFDAFVLPGHSLHQEMRLLVEAGFSPLEALQAATRNPAEYRGQLTTEGTIAVGKRADLVLLDADPLTDIANASRVSATIVGGRLHSREDLDTLRAGVVAFSAK